VIKAPPTYFQKEDVFCSCFLAYFTSPAIRDRRIFVFLNARTLDGFGREGEMRITTLVHIDARALAIHVAVDGAGLTLACKTRDERTSIQIDTSVPAGDTITVLFVLALADIDSATRIPWPAPGING